jgi:hypothetical protein
MKFTNPEMHLPMLEVHSAAEKMFVLEEITIPKVLGRSVVTTCKTTVFRSGEP